jgi:HSP20 family protein
MEDLMNRFFGGNIMAPGPEGDWVPSINIADSDGNVRVEAELPGMKPEDIDVNVSGDLLTLKGERKEEREEGEEGYTYREIRQGSFQRAVRLPAEVRADKADARFENGVLTVRLPKAEEAKAKQIEIKG